MVYVVLAVAIMFLTTLARFCIGKITAPKGVGLYGVVAGVIGNIMVLYLVLTDALGAFGPTVSAAVGIVAFVFTILWTAAGLEILLGGDFKASGWFALPGAILVLLIGLGFLGWGGALPVLPQFGVFFIIFSVAFFLVFAVFALGKGSLMKFLGWWLLIPVNVCCLFYAVIAFTNFGQIAPW